MRFNSRRLAVSVAAIGVLTVGPATAAFAADNYSPPSQIPTTAQCGTGAASGSFGAFGQTFNFGAGIGNLGGAPTGPNGVGANGPATGANNSGVCGAA